MPTPLPNEDSFHRERSKLIDAYASVEAVLVKAVTSKGEQGKGGTLATRIKAFRAAYPNLSESTEACLEFIGQQNANRTDIVHGVLGLSDSDGQRFAVFSNARDAAKDIQPATRMELAGMKRLRERLTSCASELAKVKAR
ncbi:hypothetical protein ACWPMX_06680 [Tsuneonella sp. HG094]